jgi:uncharacterized protein YndB with AHSA1/START domain
MSGDNLQLTEMPKIQSSMLIRRPPSEVFEAIADPEITSKFWFTNSTGRLEPDASVQWTWGMYNVSVPVRVKEFDKDSRLVVEMGNAPDSATIEWRFERRDADRTYVIVTVLEAGFAFKTGDDMCAWALDQMGGYSQVLAALKALLEHNVVLSLVLDAWPDGHP